MSIYKRGSVWWVRFTTPDGREVRESAQTADRRQAQEYHDQKRAESWRVEKLGEAPRRTWKEAVIRWVEEAYKKSLDKDTERLRKLAPLLGNVYLDEMTRAKIDEVVGSLPCSDSTRNPKNWVDGNPTRWCSGMPIFRRVIWRRRLKNFPHKIRYTLLKVS
ncbi:hypothetical protein CCP4SC76_150010 [Gammaproteobacteria bacterium]